jgi:hypothetical protein
LSHKQQIEPWNQQYFHGRYPNIWFWRNHQQQEVDYLEEDDSAPKGLEIKWGKSRFRVPSAFAATYPGCPVSLVN